MFNQTRRKTAGWFGRIEHHSGEFLGIYLIVLAYKLPVWYHLGALGIWILYFCSHRIEKLLYGRLGPRG